VKVAFDGAGDAVVAWVAGRRVRAVQRSAGGSWADPVTLHRAPSGAKGTFPVQLELALNEHGRSVVAWGNEDDGRDDTLAGGTLQAAIGFPDGTWGAARKLAMGGFPDAVVDSEGRATVAWTGGRGFLTRVVTAYRNAGGSWTDPRPLTPLGFGGSAHGVAVRAAGEVAVAYLTAVRGSEAFRIARRTRDGGWVKSPPLVHGMQTGKLRMGMDDAGVVTVAWTSGHQALWVAENSPAGWTPKRRVTGPGTVGDDVWLAVNAAGAALVGWTSTPGHPVQAIYRSATGGWDAKKTTLAAARGESRGPALAIDPSGDAVVVWSLRPDGSTTSRVQARRFTAARPAT
jgi:hypothetical protein